jgi:hypothetical protein
MKTILDAKKALKQPASGSETGQIKKIKVLLEIFQLTGEIVLGSRRRCK